MKIRFLVKLEQELHEMLETRHRESLYQSSTYEEILTAYRNLKAFIAQNVKVIGPAILEFEKDSGLAFAESLQRIKKVLHETRDYFDQKTPYGE